MFYKLIFILITISNDEIKIDMENTNSVFNTEHKCQEEVIRIEEED